MYWINVVHKNMNSPNNCFVRYLFYYYFIMCLAVWAQQAFGDWMRPPSWAIRHTSINMSPGSDGLKVGYPAPVVRRTGIKWCYVCVPQRPHTTVVPLEACWPEVRGIAINVHSNPEKKSMARSKNSNLCPQQSPKMSGEVQGSNSNLCPQQSRIMSMARADEQQFMSAAIPNNVHGEGRGTAIYVHNNPEKCP